jgi:hypothetical protein
MLESVQRAPGAGRMHPVRTAPEAPPRGFAQVDRFLGGLEHERPRVQHGRMRAGIFGRIRWQLREGDVRGLPHEAREALVRHRKAIDPEAIHAHAMRRSFLGIVLVGPHHELPTGNPHHVRKRWVCPGSGEGFWGTPYSGTDRRAHDAPPRDGSNRRVRRLARSRGPTGRGDACIEVVRRVGRR